MTSKVKRRALFRTDATATIGLGHLIRCLSLADALASTNWTCDFLFNASSELTAAFCKYRQLTFSCPDDEAHEIANLPRLGLSESYDLLVIDHYGRGPGYEVKLAEYGRVLLALDDMPTRPHECNILLDQTCNRVASDYSGLVPKAARLLLGPAYALLRPEFSRLRSNAKACRFEMRGLCRVLVSLGGGYRPELLRQILMGVKDSCLRLEVDIVLGEAHGLQELKLFAAQLGLPVNFHVATDSMGELMLASDICIGASGSSAWERCCLGLPSLTITLSDNQVDISKALVEAGAALLIDSSSVSVSSRVSEFLTRLSKDLRLLHRMSKAAFDVCDGLGVQRTASVIEEYL